MLGLGMSLVSGVTPTPREENLRAAFAKRITDDSGTLENDACLLSALIELI